MEDLCDNCPLRNGDAAIHTRLLEDLKVQPDDSQDRARVLALPAGEVLLAALQQPRPIRCTVLDQHLPDKKIRHAHRRQGHVLLRSCPEVELMHEVSPEEYPETSDFHD